MSEIPNCGCLFQLGVSSAGLQCEMHVLLNRFIISMPFFAVGGDRQERSRSNPNNPGPEEYRTLGTGASPL